MTFRRRLGAVMPIAALFGLMVSAQQAQTPHATKDVVRINVQVSDGTRPVLGLHLDDFDVLETAFSRGLMPLDWLAMLRSRWRLTPA